MLINRHHNKIRGVKDYTHYHTLEREQRSYRLELREESTREFEDLVVEIEVGAKICILFWLFLTLIS